MTAADTDPHGNLLDAAADQIGLANLADCLTSVGAVRGRELDIHPQMVSS